eukprot:NODE_224_length_12322_cov_0.795549.p12 type:complete len:151 gc:universal NODE_224_length_12322_cov_0.795549:6757-7209(+)
MLQQSVVAISASLITIFAMNFFKRSARIFKDVGGDMKMVLIARTDLKMTKGKIAAQCCHACLEAYESSCSKYPKLVNAWKSEGQAKVALKCESQQELMELYNTARRNGLVAEYIRDAGRTQIMAGSVTVLAIGPAPVEEIDKITGHLKLL